MTRVKALSRTIECGLMGEDPSSPACTAQAVNSGDPVPKWILPHPHSLIPRRPPRWVSRAPRRDAPHALRSRSEGWRSPRLRTDPAGGPMRINMTYRNSCTTSADFCPTIGHDVFTEGAFEGIYRAILTTDKDTCEFQFQVATITWTTKDGQDRHYTFDGGRITVDGVERWFEIKAHASYFKLPDVADVLDQAERALAAHDIALDRIDGSALLDHVRLRAVNGVLRHRNVPYSRRDVAAAHDAIHRAGGVAPHGAVAAAIGRGQRNAEAMMSAMLIRREIGFPVNGPVTVDTPVTLLRRPNRRLSRFGT